MTYTLNQGTPYAVNHSEGWVWVHRASDGVADLALLVRKTLPDNHSCKTSKAAVAKQNDR
jgi:hypothetical protein